MGKIDRQKDFLTNIRLYKTIIIVVTISSLLYAGGKLDGNVMGNVLFAVFGFAGGLFTSKNGN